MRGVLDELGGGSWHCHDWSQEALQELVVIDLDEAQNKQKRERTLLGLEG